jgi:hypothetical protein
MLSKIAGRMSGNGKSFGDDVGGADLRNRKRILSLCVALSRGKVAVTVRVCKIMKFSAARAMDVRGQLCVARKYALER